MNLPSREECFELWDKYHMPENIRKHTQMVTNLAVFISKKLKEKGYEVDVDVVDRASLLHDIDKIHTLKKHRMHGKMSQEILEKLGYPELALIVRQHLLSEVVNINNVSLESKIINYADNRIVHAKIAPLQEKLDYIEKRYGHKILEKVEHYAYKLEEELMQMLDMKPEELMVNEN
jgi:putative nucleotidyltransferase with HDIG domain